MPRRKPASATKRKAQLQLKRAVKRGDVPPPDPKLKKSNHRRKAHKISPTGEIIGSAGNAAIEASRRLQSSFITLPPHFLEDTKRLASTLPLPRPIKPEVAVLDDLTSNECSKPSQLSCPKRPKWRFDMTKIEVEKNEEGIFKKWRDETDALVEAWLKENDKKENKEGEDPHEEQVEGMPKEITDSEMPRSPTYFERNIEVWRQFWRVTEISQIILVLLDSRYPLLHYPPSLAAYLSDRKVILVLTKVDISGPERAKSWTKYFSAHYPDLQVVQVESYVEKEARVGQQGKTMYRPRLPEEFREKLMDAVKKVHAEMLEPPENVKYNEAWLQKWKPPVKRDINWGDLKGCMVGDPAPRSKDDDHSEPSDGHREYQEPEFLTIGLIGQPNVGKSSLLNALFGTHKVRASKTPGKTKHFQTLFWTPDVRLVDCPGLVMPNFVPMEMQVLSGILPISRVSAVPSCIHHAAQFLPLEQIYNLTHPSHTLPEVEDKRTWRGGIRPSASKDRETRWTAMDVLIAYAGVRGWVTAQAGRPDVHRAGNAILRAVAEGRIRWAFWPPGTNKADIMVDGKPGLGIWDPRVEHVGVESDDSEGNSDMSEEEEDNGQEEEEEMEEEEEEEGDDNDEKDEEIEAGKDPEAAGVQVGRFNALAIEDYSSEGTDEEDSNSGF